MKHIDKGFSHDGLKIMLSEKLCTVMVSKDTPLLSQTGSGTLPFMSL